MLMKQKGLMQAVRAAGRAAQTLCAQSLQPSPRERVAAMRRRVRDLRGTCFFTQFAGRAIPMGALQEAQPAVRFSSNMVMSSSLSFGSTKDSRKVARPVLEGPRLFVVMGGGTADLQNRSGALARSSSRSATREWRRLHPDQTNPRTERPVELS
jgi:hypothetical protein